MGWVEMLHKKREIFNELFSTSELVIETKDYNNSDDEYQMFLVTVKSKVDIINEVVEAEIVSVYGEIKDPLERIFKSNIPPQVIKNQGKMLVLREDVKALFLRDDWNTLYPRLLEEVVASELEFIEVEDEDGKFIVYNIRIKSVNYCY